MSKYLEQFVFLTLCVLGIVLAIIYFQTSKTSVIATELDKFSTLTDKKTQTISNQLNTKKNLLQVIDSFFRASESISEEAFTAFTLTMLETYNISDFCLIRPNQNYYFSVREQSIQNNTCENFDFLEQNKLTTDNNPQLMLSNYVKTSTGEGAYVSVLIPVVSLSIKEQHDNNFFDEYFIMFKQSDNSTHQFIFDENLSSINQPISLNQSIAHHYSNIATFSDVEFIYLTVLNDHHIDTYWYRTHTIIALLIAISFILIAVIIKNLLNQKQKIQTIVDHRTEELSQFAYRTSHDLKSPLTTIKRLAAYVEKDIKQDKAEKAINDVQKIYSQAGKLEQLVADILSLAKADLILNTSIEKIDFKNITNDIKEKYAGIIDKYNVEIHLKNINNNPVYSEKIRIVQILENIISNAIKYSDQEKNPRFVDISISNDNNNLYINIQDNGLGIRQEYIDKIFDHFTRFHPNAAIGTGMGLTITKRHIDKLGGTINVESNQQGTIFAIFIPNQKAPEA